MNERNIELLTAYIDGEVTRREQIAVLRLLNQSSEARKMLWQLQQNSLVIKKLPARTLPADFAANIVDTLKKTAALPKSAQPTPAARSPSSPHLPIRAGSRIAVRFAMAAAVLLAVGGGLYYFLHRPDEQQLAGGNSSSSQEGSKTPAGPDAPRNEANHPKSEGENPAPKPAVKPVDFAFADLKQPGQQELLAAELAKNSAFRMDLYVKKNRRTEALVQLGRELHLQVNKGKNKDREEELYIFAENLLPFDVAGFLGKLAGEKKGEFDRLRLQPMSKTDRQLVLARLRLSDENELDHPRLKLETIIEGKNKKDQAPPPVVVKTPERRAVVLTKEDSDQRRNFVDQRVALKPNTIQVLFVLHSSAATARLDTARDDMFIVSLP